MNAFLSRCRHAKVNWLNTHSCQCVDCGKTGHWFEPEGLVMWIRDQKNEESNPLIPTNVTPQTTLDPCPVVASRAG